MEDALSEYETRNKILHCQMMSTGQVISLFQLFINAIAK